jgi:hypothetical protein
MVREAGRDGYGRATVSGLFKIPNKGIFILFFKIKQINGQIHFSKFFEIIKMFKDERKNFVIENE